MKIVQMKFSVSTRERNQMIEITGQVRSIVKEAGIKNGDVVVYCPHTTAAITINENADSSVLHDILWMLSKLIPAGQSGFRHVEGNSDSHCKSSLIGCSERVILQDGKLSLGTWQGIFFCEFDGPRTRSVLVKIQGE